jgi:acetylornithine/succinyldiaminopimelate/putrescine aminotransferase
MLIDASGFRRMFFANSGTEATEGAMKIARKWGSSRSKNVLIAFTNSFHGRTYGALSLMDRVSYREGYGPFLDHCLTIPFNDAEALRKAVTPETAALFIEGIQGEGGIRTANREFIEEINRLQRQFGFLLVADEIQCGLGRTGRMFAFEHFGMRPDLVLLAKPLGGGLPLGAILGGEAVEDVLEPGAHGSTFGGNALACAAGCVVVRELTQGNLLANVQKMGERLRDELLRMKAAHPSTIRDVRGIGLMLGVELFDEARPFVDALRERKVLVNSTDRTVLRIVPALTIEETHVAEFIRALEDVLATR